MTATALLLNADYRPLRVIPWFRAVYLVLDEKADLVEEYIGRAITTSSGLLARPAVVRLRRFANIVPRVRFNRQNVLARDSYRCLYCGVRPRRSDGKPDLEALTIDHLIPRAQSKNAQVYLPWSKKVVPVTCWENVVTACIPCNTTKDARTPGEAGMRLARWPRSPTSTDILRMSLIRVSIPEEWKVYLPKDSEWRGYWTDQLDED